ncbi:MAG: 16S rRNA (cytidine(1402)-2'-O)-methyltransferase [Actinobacteria bacterium]|nr:MAG: 16S rRNA (cytidine(1402)-2'-O)-methyltransferase [Actinomycetota bacterium]
MKQRATHPGRLLVCATPIGNLADVTLRVLEALRTCDLIAAEDTRQARKLLAAYEISKPLVSYHDRNERSRTPELVSKLESGTAIALVSDAGTPGIADPGHRLINACIDRDIPIQVLPGPNAAIAALVLSGFPSEVFTVAGFSPRRPGPRRKFFDDLLAEGRTFSFYESPHRVLASLSDLAEASPSSRIALARELTKVFEEVIRGDPAQVRDRLAESGPRGEMVIVVAPPKGKAAKESPAALAAAVADLERQGLEKKEAMRAVAKSSGTTRRAVYDAVVSRASSEERPGS